EREVLDRGVPDAQAQDRRRPVPDDPEPGQQSVTDQLAGDHDRVRGPEHPTEYQPGTEYREIEHQRQGDGDHDRKRVRHRRSTLRTASKPSTAQSGTTRKNSTSSTGSRPASRTPVVWPGSKVQCPAAIAARSHPMKTAATGSTVSSRRRHRRSTPTRSTGSNQIAPARQPASTAR